MNRERLALLALLSLGALGAALGLLDRPSAALHDGAGEQILDLVRVLGTASLAVSLLLGPGAAWRALAGRESLGLAFLPLPGLLLLAATGGLAWLLADAVDPLVTCFALLAPALGWVLGTLLFAGPEEIFDREERWALLVVGCVLGLAVARALWSLGPVGELYPGSVSRTLEVGDRPDSRISFILPQLVAHGERPYDTLAASFYFPYNFSSRGPVPGLASAPVVLLAGGRPPAELPDQAWAPFDAQGFMAYRLAMMAFACTAFVVLWDLVRRLAGPAAARLALLLAATTPFLVHEVWFTWPKLLAAGLVLAAAICVIERRGLAGGLLAGLGYLAHPVALISLPVLGLLAAWPLCGARWRRPQIGRVALLIAGLAASLLTWRLLNGSHYDQEGFLEYLTAAGFDPDPGLAEWARYRLTSVANTLVPLLLPLAFGDNYSINVVGGISPGVVHFFFQYWTGLPFGVAIVFLPLLLLSVGRAMRRWPWAVTATVLVPFGLFAIYWGASTTGMLREGLQAWVLTLLAVVACEQAAGRFGWLRSTPVRAILTLRVVEVLAMLTIPTVATRHELLGDSFLLTDAFALAAFVACGGALAAMIWNARAPDHHAEGARVAGKLAADD